MTHPSRTQALLFKLAALALAAPLGGCLAPSAPAENDESTTLTPSCAVGDTKICQQDVNPDQQGLSTCEAGEHAGSAEWSECKVNPDMGKANCDPSMELWDGYCCVDTTNGCCAGEYCNTPLVLAFDDAPVRYTTMGESAGFDLSREGLSQRFDWPTAATPWLALDLDGDGAIEDGGELFGSATRLPNGRFASNGFEALATLDENRDGRIDSADPAYARILVWRDANADRVSSASELTSLASEGVYRLDVDYRVARTCDDRGNCGVEQGTMSFLEGDAPRQGRIIDVHLQVR